MIAGFQIVHVVLLILGAIGFFLFWIRTRFWLPGYAHILAAIALLVGAWSVSITPNDAPINKAGTIGRVLLALAVPAMVYFFFVFYGGQRAAFRRKPKAANEIANLIDRFVTRTSLYPEEWNDFVHRKHPDVALDAYRTRCGFLDPFVNRSEPRDPKALEELKHMVQELRRLSTAD